MWMNNPCLLKLKWFTDCFEKVAMHVKMNEFSNSIWGDNISSFVSSKNILERPKYCIITFCERLLIEFNLLFEAKHELNGFRMWYSLLIEFSLNYSLKTFVRPQSSSSKLRRRCKRLLKIHQTVIPPTSMAKAYRQLLISSTRLINHLLMIVNKDTRHSYKFLIIISNSSAMAEN